jgi:hypothetical protein
LAENQAFLFFWKVTLLDVKLFGRGGWVRCGRFPCHAKPPPPHIPCISRRRQHGDHTAYYIAELIPRSLPSTQPRAHENCRPFSTQYSSLQLTKRPTTKVERREHSIAAPAPKSSVLDEHVLERLERDAFDGSFWVRQTRGSGAKETQPALFKSCERPSSAKRPPISAGDPHI